MQAQPGTTPDNDHAAPISDIAVGRRSALGVSTHQAANEALDDLPARYSASTAPCPASKAMLGKRQVSADATIGRPASTQHSPRAEALLETYLTKRQATVLQLVAELLDSSSLGIGLTSLADALQHRLACTRVVVGVVRSSRLQIQDHFTTGHLRPALRRGRVVERCSAGGLRPRYPGAVS